MEVLSIILVSFSCLLIIVTLLPLLPFNHWSVRGWEFPRLQIAVFLAGTSIGCALVFPFTSVWHYILNLSVLGCLGYQLFKIMPYTPVYRNQVVESNNPDNENTISLLASNVYMPNTNFNALLHLVDNMRPDVLLTLETNKRWEHELQVLEQDYIYTVKVPLENLYGMHLYSKLPLEDMKVQFLIDDEIPSIHGKVVLPSGEKVELHCLHPMPPSPTESETSTDRDAEILLVGRNIDTDRGPVIVLGDLNDVAWSYTTNLFQKVSGLLDPRKGRGFFNTFNAKYPFFRWPLDHIFHSNHFTLNQIERLPTIGSDHFPMYISLHLEPIARHVQVEPECEPEEQQMANEKVAEGMR